MPSTLLQVPLPVRTTLLSLDYIEHQLKHYYRSSTGAQNLITPRHAANEKQYVEKQFNRRHCYYWYSTSVTIVVIMAHTLGQQYQFESVTSVVLASCCMHSLKAANTIGAGNARSTGHTASSSNI
jgi:hypothetical protein